MQIVLTRQEQRKLRRLVKKAKEVVPGIIGLTVFTLLLGLSGYNDSHYTINAKVTKCTENLYLVEDEVGYIWEFEDNREFEVGTSVKLVMHNGHTHNTKVDDKVVDVK
jgi:hypothetical protein